RCQRGEGRGEGGEACAIQAFSALAATVGQDRPAPPEVLGLGEVEAGTPEVDEVKIDAVDPGAAEGRAAEVGLADLLGRLEVLLVEVVGVKPGAAPLGSDRAADQAAPRRAEVEGRISEVGPGQAGTLPFDLGEAGLLEVRPAEVGPGQLRAGQQGAAEI